MAIFSCHKFFKYFSSIYLNLCRKLMNFIGSLVVLTVFDGKKGFKDSTLHEIEN